MDFLGISRKSCLMKKCPREVWATTRSHALNQGKEFLSWHEGFLWNFLLWLDHFSNCLAVDEVNVHKLWRQKIRGRRMFTNYVWWRWQVGDLLVPAAQSGLPEVPHCYCCRWQFWNTFGQTILSKTIWIIVAVFGVSFVVDLVSFIFFVHIHSTRRIFSTEAVAIFFVVIKDVNPGMPKRSQFFACDFIWIISLTQHQNSHQWLNCSILTTIRTFVTLVRVVIYGDDQ